MKPFADTRVILSVRDDMYVSRKIPFKFRSSTHVGFRIVPNWPPLSAPVSLRRPRQPADQHYARNRSSLRHESAVASRLAATATASATALPDACFRKSPSSPPPPPTAATNPSGNTTRQPVALCDFLARRLHAAIAAASPAASSHGIRSDYDSEAVGQFVLETNRAAVSASTGAVSVVFEVWPARRDGGGAWQLCEGGREQKQDGGRGAEMAEVLRGIVKQTLLGSVHPGGGLDAAAALAHVEVCRCTQCSHEAHRPKACFFTLAW